MERLVSSQTPTNERSQTNLLLAASFQREYGRSFDSEVIREPREASPVVEEVPQDDDAPSFQRTQPSDRLGKLSKSEKIEAELAKGKKPAKEVFAAFGLDESWTHVAVRLMERPAPGVYVTAKGKARPAGKKQGRPKESRITVFKSLSLVEFLKSTAPPVEEPVQVDTPAVTVAPTPAPAEELSNINAVSDGSTAAHVLQSAEPVGVPPVDAMDFADQTVTADSEEHVPSERVDQPQSSQPPRDTPLEEITTAAVSSTATPTGARETPLSDETKPTTSSLQPRVGYPKSRRSDKDGSVARLRRNIVMTLIEQAGGAFPSSSELWHAFATVWIRKYNHTETPDSRTVKGAVKYLVDAGKLRQLTFSGRNPKGEMVTRSIVMKPDLDPSDPLVTHLQDKMLNSTYYVPKNVELDPNIAKIVRGGSSAVAAAYQKVTPVEPSMTVTLKNKPAFVLALEKRREESLQKRLQKPVRLMGLQRKSKTSKGITSFTRPPRTKKRRIEPALPKQGHEEGTDYDVPRGAMEMTLLKHRVSQPLDRALAEVKRRRVESSTTAETPYRRFVGEIDFISHWERINQNAAESNIPPLSNPFEDAGHLSYVHHTIDEPFEQAPIDGMIQFDVDGAPRRKFRRAPPAVKARRQKRAAAEIMPSEEPEPDHEVFNLPEQYQMPLEYMVPQQLPREYDTFVEPQPEEDVPAILENELQEVATSPPGLDTTKTPMARRRRKGLRDLGPRFIERLRYAIVVVRTIAGGAHGKAVDWHYVARAFPRDDPVLVRQNGKLLMNRDRRQLAQIQEDIRDILLEEYRKPNCSLPHLDFNNLDDYDWDALTTWAATQYYSPSTREVPNLPGSRAQFDRLHEYRVVQTNDHFETIYTPNPAITIAKRESMYAVRPFVHTTSKSKWQRKRDEKDTAKSWILSNIVAKEQTYNSVEAKEKLSQFPSDVIDECVKEFVRDRVIMQENRGRIIPGRNYSLTENFYHAFGRRRAVDIDMLRQAVQTKQTLDDDFERDGFSQVRYTAVDGEAMAIMALAAEGRVRIHPSDPPSNPMGLTEGNYETRGLDKAKFKFQMVVTPDSQRYEYGNPVRETVSTHPIPIVEQDQTALEKPPLWVDINGNVNQDMWQSVVCSVVGILAVRPNIPAQGICEQLQGYLALWDVERTLTWLEEVGLATKVDREGDSMWKAKGYWWLVASS